MKYLISVNQRKYRSTCTLVIVLGILMLIGLACGGSKPAPEAYVGSWTGSDGTTITIRPDGRADYKSSSASVDNGSVTIDEAAKTLKIAFIGMGPTFTIDKAPSGNQMTLSGVVFKKGGSDTKISSTSSSNSSSKKSGDDPFKGAENGDVPSDAVAEALIRDSLQKLAVGIEDDDFSDLYDSTSTDFKSSYSLEQMSEMFKSFVENKAKLLPIIKQADSVSAKFSPAVSVRTEKGLKVLVADGSFGTSPATLNFETEYVDREGQWKMLKLVVRIR